MADDDEDHVISLPGPRIFIVTYSGVIWSVFWYAFQAMWLSEILAGNGHLVRGMPHEATQPSDWLLWTLFVLGPTVLLRYVAWNALGRETLAQRDGVVVLERTIWGVGAYPRQEFAASAIRNVRAEAPAPRDGTMVRWYDPDAQGAIAFDYDLRTIRFGASLLGDPTGAEQTASTLRGWLNSPSRHASFGGA